MPTRPGQVEIWDLIAPDEKDAAKKAGTRRSIRRARPAPRIKLAGKIARTVKAWCARGTRPRDVLILVRQRGACCSRRSSARSSAKASRLPAPTGWCSPSTSRSWICWCSATRLLLPDDDLALATVLKSPLFGLDDEQLYTLAYGRDGPLTFGAARQGRR